MLGSYIALALAVLALVLAGSSTSIPLALFLATIGSVFSLAYLHNPLD